MQLCRRRRTFISLAYVVWGGDATRPAEKLLSWRTLRAWEALPARLQQPGSARAEPRAAAAAGQGKKSCPEPKRDLHLPGLPVADQEPSRKSGSNFKMRF